MGFSRQEHWSGVPCLLHKLLYPNPNGMVINSYIWDLNAESNRTALGKSIILYKGLYPDFKMQIITVPISLTVEDYV